jgi:hypothetical protein
MKPRRTSPKYNPETAQATLAACEWDLDHEERRMATIDAKLAQLAAFSGIAISISAGVGGSVLAARHLPFAFMVGLGSCLALAAALLLAGVIAGFRALAPKLYHGVDEKEVVDRTTPAFLRQEASEALATFAASRRDILTKARSINDRKAEATSRVFTLVGGGFAFLVLAILVTAVGSLL